MWILSQNHTDISLAAFGRKEIEIAEVCAAHPRVPSRNLNLRNRFSRAVKWSSAKDAIERVEDTLKWRREFGVWDLSADELKVEVCWVLSLP